METDESTRIERVVRVGSLSGLHARPAACVVQAAKLLPAKVMIGKPGGEAVPARSIMRLLSINVEFGDDVVVSAEGPDAEESVATIAGLVLSNLDEVTGDEHASSVGGGER